MSIADLVRRMADAGAPPEAIAIAVEAVEAGQAADAARREKRAEQKRQERARRATVARHEADIERQGCDTPHPPSLDKETPPTPPKEIKPSPLTPQTTQLSAGGQGDFDRLSQRLSDAADGKMQPTSALVVGPIIELIAQGVDLETDILPAIRAKAATLSRPVDLKYFLGPIRDAYEARIAAGKGLARPKKVAPLKPDADMSPDELRAAWRKRLNYGRAYRSWPEFWGPMPGQPGCTAPPDMLEPKDGQHPDGSPWDIQRIEAA